jgi:hypothetical protein
MGHLISLIASKLGDMPPFNLKSFNFLKSNFGIVCAV